MKIYITTFLLCLLAIGTFAQDATLEEYVKRGIILHDEGKYKQAIREYEKALKIDNKSALVHYEIAYSYTELGDKKSALKHVNKALKAKGSGDMPMLYVMKGNLLDDVGKTRQAIKVYEKGLQQFPNFYMILFNMGITYANAGMDNKAKNAFIRSIASEFGYASSHYHLGKLMEKQDRKIPAIMSYYFFLMLEPETIRADEIYNKLMNLLFKNESENGNTTIKINLGSGDMSDLEFAPLELLLSLDMTEVLKETGVALETPKTDTEKLIKKTELLFEILEEKDDNKKGIWWDFYAPFYAKISDCEVITAFCYHIGQSKGGDIALWLEGHEEEVTEFVECVNSDE